MNRRSASLQMVALSRLGVRRRGAIATWCVVYLAATFGLAGCSLLNAPDRRLISTDAGVDAGDGGSDADTGVPDEICDNGIDDDGDGLSDCIDFACAGRAQCCDVGSTVLQETWDPADNLSATWAAIPSASASYPVREFVSGTPQITAFEGPNTSAILTRSCVPLALGLELAITFSPMSEGTCRDHCEASLVLTGAQDLLAGEHLPDDLAVRMDSEGLLTVSQAGRTLATATARTGASQRTRVTLRLGSAFRENEAVVEATVTAHNLDTDTREILLENEAFLAREDLIDNLARCDESEGLFVAIEGHGDRVHVGALEATTLRCANPDQFQVPPDAPLTAERLGVGTWAAGGIGRPALVSSQNGADVQWDLLFDGTNVDRQAERFVSLGLALGHAQTTTWNASPWIQRDGPRIGEDPPACTGEGCGIDEAFREPSAFASLDASDRIAQLYSAFARRLPTTDGTERYGLWAQLVARDPNTVEAPRATAVLMADEGCQSLRTPSIAPAGASFLDAGFLLFYTCERTDDVDEIHVLRLSASLEAMGQPATVVTAGDLPDYAEGGVNSPAVWVDFDSSSQAAVYRLWFLAHSGGGAESSLAMMQAQVDTAGELPRFRPYPGNPVLRAGDDPLGGCPGTCTISGVSVTRRIDSAQVLRLLVALDLNDAGTTSYKFVPLEQFWHSPLR